MNPVKIFKRKVSLEQEKKIIEFLRYHGLSISSINDVTEDNSSVVLSNDKALIFWNLTKEEEKNFMSRSNDSYETAIKKFNELDNILNNIYKFLNNFNEENIVLVVNFHNTNAFARFYNANSVSKRIDFIHSAYYGKYFELQISQNFIKLEEYTRETKDLGYYILYQMDQKNF